MKTLEQNWFHYLGRNVQIDIRHSGEAFIAIQGLGSRKFDSSAGIDMGRAIGIAKMLVEEGGK